MLSVRNAVAVLSVVGLAGAAWSQTYTNINPTPHVNERSPNWIINHLGMGGDASTNLWFGTAGTFNNQGATAAAVNSLVFTGTQTIGSTVSTVTVTRVADGGAGTVNPFALLNPAANANDTTFRDGVVQSQLRARYASFQQEFGWMNGASTGAPVASGPASTTFNSLLTLTGDNNQVFLGPATTTVFSGEFRFARRSPNSGDIVTSNPLDQGGFDQMVMYRVDGLQGLAGRAMYLLFFEDIVRTGDYDFNDLVVELVVAPLPSAAWAGFGGLGLVVAGAVLRRRRAVAPCI